jgi:hypothetical protein
MNSRPLRELTAPWPCDRSAIEPEPVHLGRVWSARSRVTTTTSPLDKTMNRWSPSVEGTTATASFQSDPKVRRRWPRTRKAIETLRVMSPVNSFTIWYAALTGVVL